MWYFTWLLGVLLACSLGVINVLRLEAQEALAKEHQALDPLTRLLTKESVFQRLLEKVDNSKRNGLPFSLMYLSLSIFIIKHQLAAHELDTTLLKVVASINDDIRIGPDILARVGEEEFLLVLPGISFDTATKIASRIKHNICNKVKTPRNTAVDIRVGIAEYSALVDSSSKNSMTGAEEVDVLLNIALNRSFEPTQAD